MRYSPNIAAACVAGDRTRLTHSSKRVRFAFASIARDNCRVGVCYGWVRDEPNIQEHSAALSAVSDWLLRGSACDSRSVFQRSIFAACSRRRAHLSDCRKHFCPHQICISPGDTGRGGSSDRNAKTATQNFSRAVLKGRDCILCSRPGCWPVEPPSQHPCLACAHRCWGQRFIHYCRVPSTPTNTATMTVIRPPAARRLRSGSGSVQTERLTGLEIPTMCRRLFSWRHIGPSGGGASGRIFEMAAPPSSAPISSFVLSELPTR